MRGRLPPDAMQSQHEAEREAERAAILAELRALRAEIAELKTAKGAPDGQS